MTKIAENVELDMEDVIKILLRRVGGRVAFTRNELARAQEEKWVLREDGHLTKLWLEP